LLCIRLGIPSLPLDICWVAPTRHLPRSSFLVSFPPPPLCSIQWRNWATTFSPPTVYAYFFSSSAQQSTPKGTGVQRSQQHAARNQSTKVSFSNLEQLQQPL
jgi:hypothetical protein